MVEDIDLLVNVEMEIELPASRRPKSEITVIAGTRENFNACIVTVPTGEDVKSKILSVVKNWDREICILSAIGKVSDVSLRRSEGSLRSDVSLPQSEGSLRFKGCFDIVTLAGSFPLTEAGHASGELTVSLAGNGGLMVVGKVADLLIAASSIQLVLGSFIPPNANLPSAIPSVNVASPNPLTSLATPEAGTSFSFTPEPEVERLFQRLSLRQAVRQSRQNNRMNGQTEIANSVSNGNSSNHIKPSSPEVNLNVPSAIPSANIDTPYSIPPKIPEGFSFRDLPYHQVFRF